MIMESVLGEDGKIDTGNIGMIFYESFSNSYYRLGGKVGKPGAKERYL